VPRATTALNIIQQVGGAIGTAIMSVLLTNALADRLPQAGGGAEAGASVPREVRAQVAPLMADAFGSVFVWATIFLAISFIPALFLPRHKAEPATEDDFDPDAAEPAPVLMHA
jgi:hypothetical protein